MRAHVVDHEQIALVAEQRGQRDDAFARREGIGLGLATCLFGKGLTQFAAGSVHLALQVDDAGALTVHDLRFFPCFLTRHASARQAAAL